MQKVESSNLFTRSSKVEQRDLALTPGRVFCLWVCYYVSGIRSGLPVPQEHLVGL